MGGREGERAGTDAKNARPRIFERTLTLSRMKHLLSILALLLVAAPAKGGEPFPRYGNDLDCGYCAALEFDRLVALLGDEVLRDLVCRLSSERYSFGSLSSALGRPEGQVMRRIKTLRGWGLVRTVRHDSALTIVEPTPGDGGRTLQRWAQRYCPQGDSCGRPLPVIRGAAESDDEMFEVRISSERGITTVGGIESKHSFSFGQYHNPDHMGFGALHAINENRVEPGTGFASHGHMDMEIITIVLEGALAHRDDAGNGSVIRPGEVQRMTAGKGVRHVENNHSNKDALHFIQIWIRPDERDLAPSYEQKDFSKVERLGRLVLIASRDGGDGSVSIHRDANIYSSLLSKGRTTWFDLAKDRIAWLQVTRGSLTLNGIRFDAGDGAGITDESEFVLTGTADDTEILLVDMKRLQKRSPGTAAERTVPNF